MFRINSDFFIHCFLPNITYSSINEEICSYKILIFFQTFLSKYSEGVAGATAFRADAALVVTWYNTASAISGRADIDGGQLATYQVVWLTDQAGRLSYVILNYDKLGFDAADIRMNSRSGRCQVFYFLNFKF